MIESGATQPFECRLEDGNHYAVKGRRATARGLISEAIAASLGHAIGLPIPDFATCRLAPSLLLHITDDEARYSLGQGPCFASQWVQPAEEFNLSMIRKVGHNCLAELYAFDHWIMNGDRTLTRNGGNVNLLLALPTEELVAFDHNLAFDQKHHQADLAGHVGRASWLRMKDVVGFKEGLAERMFNAHASLSGYVEAIPEEWLEDADSMIERVELALRRSQADQFWNELG